MSVKERSAGILLHPSSLPGPYGIGSLGSEAYEFVDWLESSGCSWWQILPLVPNGRENSPYFSWSAFAGNPLFVDIEELIAEGLLDSNSTPGFEFSDHEVRFQDVISNKMPLLFTAAEKLIHSPKHPLGKDYQAFRDTQTWVEDTSLFYLLRYHELKVSWQRWDLELRLRNKAAVSRAKRKLSSAIDQFAAILFFFDHQWHKLRRYALDRGIRVIGDLPIYVDLDSADVWMHQELFKLDEHGNPTVVSGVPPDYFSATGQLWGNPIYLWDVHARDNYSWWRNRLRRCTELADVVRIDHFRALAAYWEIPVYSSDPRAGYWMPGPGQQFLDAVRQNRQDLPLIAEDLGTLDLSVHALRDLNGLMGMRILQFGFDGDHNNSHLPHTFPEACVCYTGTHDNETLAGWRKGLPLDRQYEVTRYYQISDPHCPNEAYVWSLIEAAIGSRARLAVIPAQDLLVHDNWARMNRPDAHEGNWKWRLGKGELTEGISNRLLDLLRRYGRAAK